MSKIRVESFGSVPPCAGDIQVGQLLQEIAREYGERVEIVRHTGPGDPQWAEYAIDIVPALVVGEVVRFVGVVPSRESLTGALCRAGLT
jgi:hypothetical protein